MPAHADESKDHHYNRSATSSVQLGPRPFYLVNDMEDSSLKQELKKCGKGPFKKSDFSIGHRGAGMQFPEHTKESYVAAAKMGAGILECDVTFTKDRELVCRHSQCDLHTTTNILATPLASKCSVQPDYNSDTPFANVSCCTSDLTLTEFKSLKGKMDAGNPKAKTLADYMNSTPNWRTDLYTAKGTLVSHKESIALFKSLGVKMTPELKSASVTMPFEGDYTQENYAQQMINEYKQANVKAKDVFAQSFDKNDILYWIEHEPAFSKQAVFLDDINAVSEGYPSLAELEALKAEGVNIIAPAMWALLDINAYGEIVPSSYAINAKAADLDIITWTLERSGLLKNGGGWYYQSTTPVINNDGDMLEVLDVLAQDVGIKGMFSDWPATVTYYANCKGL
ncbi:MAG: glycerophosphodiester phosphodiesterase family protein [Woeseiaceae bacterium]